MKVVIRNILIGIIAGVGVGLFFGGALWFAQDMFSFITCNDENPEFKVSIVIICAIIFGFLGLIDGISEKMEDEKRIAKLKEEEERLAEAKRRQEEAEKMHYRVENANREFEVWQRQLSAYCQQIENVVSKNKPEDIYKSILLASAPKNDTRYREEFKHQLREHIARMRKRILASCSIELTGESAQEIRKGGLEDSVYVCKCLMMAEEIVWGNKTKIVFYQPLLKILEPLNVEAKKNIYYLKFEAYGAGKLLLDDPQVMKQVEERIPEMERKLNTAQNYIISLKNGQNIGEETIPTEFDSHYIEEAAMLMWYYAKKKPFNTEKFTMSQKLFRECTSIIYIQDENETNITKVEDLLARIYAKNQIGGAGTVRQEVEYMTVWLEQKIKWGFYEECYILASGLAWMELYELELQVLRKLVERKVQLPEELQERLSFLESGGLTNVKVYEVNESDTFLFDNSSLEWSTKEYNVFFRKINMKKMWPNYSLAVSKWTKTLPLLKGQKVSFEDIYEDLKQLVEDFDGEITCRQTDVRAVDLENVIYKNATVFRFTTERNRCVSVIFSGEKYGRNLNLTVLTMFTPDKTLSLDSLEKYCLAIKNNTYVESLRESILQTIDESLKVKESVYDDSRQEPKKKIFDEDWE